MSIEPQDLIQLGFEADLTQAGLALVCRSLGNLGPQPTPNRLRQWIAHTAAELALRRWFDHHKLEYQLIQLRPFTQPQRRTIIMGGRRLHVHVSLISDPFSQKRMLRSPATCLSSHLELRRIPPGIDIIEEGDLHAFALIMAKETRSLESLRRRAASGAPMALFSLPQDRGWYRPREWRPLNKVRVSNRCPHPVSLDMIGHAANRALLQMTTRIPANAEKQPTLQLHTLLCLRTYDPPHGCVALRSARRTHAWLVHPHDWHNLWLYGQAIIFLGWLTQAQCRARALRRGAVGSNLSLRPLQIQADRLEPMARLLHLLEGNQRMENKA